MRSKRLRVNVRVVKIFSILIIGFMGVTYLSSWFFHNKDVFTVFSKIPIINKFFSGEKLLASFVFEPQLSDSTSPDSELKKSMLKDYEVPKNQDIKIGTFKKVKDQKSFGGSGVATAGSVSVQEVNSQGKTITKTARAEISICKAGHIRGFVYISVPSQDLFKVEMARIKAPLLNLDSPFAFVPLVKGEGENKDYYFLVSSDSKELLDTFHKLTDSFVKNDKVDKGLFKDFMVQLLVSVDKSSGNNEEDRNFTLARILENPLIGGLTHIPFVDQLISSRAPLEHISDDKDREAAYRSLVDTLLDDKSPKSKGGGVNSVYYAPEIEACREVLDKKITDFTFRLVASQKVDDVHKHGLFKPIKSGTQKSNFLVPYDQDPRHICKGNECHLDLVYKGDPGLVLFNQLNICYNALAQYSNRMRAPLAKDARVVHSAAEDVLYADSRLDTEQIAKSVVTAIVFDITSQKPLYIGVIDRALGALVQDPYKWLQKLHLNIIQRILSIGESGLFRKVGKAEAPFGAIPINTDCTCNLAEETTIANRFYASVPDWARPLLRAAIKSKTAALSLLGVGLEWNCSFQPGILFLSSTFDTEYSKVAASVANVSLAKDVVDISEAPQNYLRKYSFEQIASALGRLSGCEVDIEEPSIDIKSMYKADLGKAPIYIHQKVYFDTYPPLVKGNISSFELPSVFRSPKKAFISFPVFSKASGSLRINNLMSQFEKMPLSGKADTPDPTLLKIFLCYMSLYTNTSFGHMEFTCRDGSNTAEADFYPDDSVCQGLTDEDYKKLQKILMLEPDALRVSGKFDNLDGVFKKN